MTRAEFFALTGNGRWRKCRVGFRCERIDKHNLRCTNEIKPKEEYFDSGFVVRVGINSKTGNDFPRTMRICFKCASEEIPK
jgi:hypothetical protein